MESIMGKKSFERALEIAGGNGFELYGLFQELTVEEKRRVYERLRETTEVARKMIVAEDEKAKK